MKKPLKECETDERCDGRCVDCIRMETISIAAKETIIIHNTAHSIMQQIGNYPAAVKIGIASAVFAETIVQGCQESMASRTIPPQNMGFAMMTPDQLKQFLNHIEKIQTKESTAQETKSTRIEVE